MSDEKQEFTPEQVAEFEAYQNYLVDKQNRESATSLYPAAGGTLGAAAGAAIGAKEAVPKMVKGAVKGIGKSFASGVAEGAPTMTSGDKWAKAIGGPGGVNQDVAVQNRAMQKGLSPKEAAEFKVAREGLIVPKKVEAEIAKEAAAKAATIPGRVAGVASNIKSALGPMAPVAGKALALGSAGYDVGDVIDRSNKGQYGRAAVSGLGALGSAATLVPHPIVKGVGMGASVAAPALNILLDKLAKENPELFEKLHMAVGGLVHLATGGQVFDPQGADYDYQTAVAHGMGPTGTGQNQGHWGSVAPTSDDERMLHGLPEDSYVVLKGKNHQTFHKAETAENERGSKIEKFGKRYYSIPK